MTASPFALSSNVSSKPFARRMLGLCPSQSRDSGEVWQPGEFYGYREDLLRAVYRPRRMGGFTKLHVIDGQPTQPVLLVGPDGDFAVALYTMKKQVHGEWKILGCSLIP